MGEWHLLHTLPMADKTVCGKQLHEGHFGHLKCGIHILVLAFFQEFHLVSGGENHESAPIDTDILSEELLTDIVCIKFK